MSFDSCTSRTNIQIMTAKCVILLFFSDFVHSYGYPLFGGRHYVRTVPSRRSAYLPLSDTHRRNEFQLPDYEDGYLTNPTDEYEYNVYEKYPFVQYFGYYPNRDYYHDKTTRRSIDGYGYFNEPLPHDPVEEVSVEVEKDGGYPYGQETWYEEEIPRYDSNAEANAAFLQNLIMAQMYQDARTQYPLGYDSLADDYDDQHWFYGVPTTEVEEKEKVKQYFKNKEDEEVKELESLAKKKSKNKKLKEKDSLRKHNIERPTKPLSKMTNDEYFDMQKQIIVNSRKNNYIPVAEGLRLSKKQFHDPLDVNNNFWDFSNARLRYPEPQTNSIKKLNINKGDKLAKDLTISETKSTGKSSVEPASSTAAPKRPPSGGQKEVVLPRPSNPVRRPFPEISTRSLHEPSVYDTIKKLLNMDKDLQMNEISQPQKRFVLNEDQLTAELSGLKKLSP